MSYFVSLSEKELVSFYRNPIVLLQAGPIERRLTWNATRTFERGEKMGVQFLRLQVALTSKNAGTTGIPIEGKDLPIQVRTEYPSF